MSMSALYIKWRGGIANLHGTVDGVRIRKSLKTRDPHIAEQLRHKEEAKIRKVRCKPESDQAKIYVISNGEFLKICIAADPINRLGHLQVGAPNDLELLYAVEVIKPQARDIEKRTHGLLGRNGVGGEWFRCSKRQAISAIHRAIRDTNLAQPFQNASGVS